MSVEDQMDDADRLYELELELMAEQDEKHKPLTAEESIDQSVDRQFRNDKKQKRQDKKVKKHQPALDPVLEKAVHEAVRNTPPEVIENMNSAYPTITQRVMEEMDKQDIARTHAILDHLEVDNEGEDEEAMELASHFPAVAMSPEEFDYGSETLYIEEAEGETLDENRILNFFVLPAYDRIVVDDGISPLSFDMNRIDWLTKCNVDINEAFPDAKARGDYVENVLGNLLNFVISTKYPYAVMKCDYFTKVLRSVKEFDDRDHFRFFCYKDYVFIYLIDDESYNDLMELLDAKDMSDQEIMDFAVNLAKMAINIHNCFNYYDDDLISTMAEDEVARDCAYSLIVQSGKAQYTWQEGSWADGRDFDDMIDAFHIEDIDRYRKDMIQFLLDMTGDTVLGRGIWDGYDLYEAMDDAPGEVEVEDGELQPEEAPVPVIKEETIVVQQVAETVEDSTEDLVDEDEKGALVTEADLDELISKMTENQIQSDRPEKEASPKVTVTPVAKPKNPSEENVKKRQILRKLKDLKITGYQEEWPVDKLQEFFKDKLNEMMNQPVEPMAMPPVASEVAAKAMTLDPKPELQPTTSDDGHVKIPVFTRK